MARYALVIGIADYQGSLPRLSKTTTDAEAIAQVLEQYGNFQEVKRLPARWNAEKNCYEMVARPVTGAELGQALRTFLQEQAVNSEALIYFAGHGIQVFDHLGQQSGYLATSDCTFETKEGRIVDQRHGISLDSFNNTIRSSNLSSLVVLLDCCHSGYLLERSFIEQTLTAFNSSSRRDYCLITASRGFEKAYVGQEHSIFTEAVLDGLSRKNAESDGQLGQTISGDRLFDYISRALKNSGQEPLRLGWGRSIPLVTYPIEQTATNPGEFKPENPYLGLYAFNTEQADYFFGREPAVKDLTERLSNNRFLAVIGPSGCGKSSLVKAGLFPEFQRDRLPGSSQWEIESFTPGKHPIEPLLEILARQHRKNHPYVLFIDQLEELFTLCEDETERRSFIRMMSEEATSSDRPTRVIVAIRGDFLDRCAAYPETAVLINRTRTTTYFVTPLSTQALEEVIEQPASLHGVTFERGLVSQIANDVEDQPGALPLLQYALKELWRVCIEEALSPHKELTWQGYEAIGGVRGALEQRANLLYRSFSDADQAFVRRLCLELVQLGEGEEVTRRRASWERLEAIADSPEQLQRVVRLLAGQQQRLIITDEKTAEVAHEALLAEWTLLRHWIEENRETIRISRRLEADCREWQDKGQSDDYLLTAGRLVAIAEWVEKTQPKLPTLEAEFLQKSLKKRDQELQTQLVQERRLREEAEAKAEAEKRGRKFAAAAGILATSTLGLGLLAQIYQAQIIQEQLMATEASILKSQELLEKNNELEALMASIKTLEKLKSTGRERNFELQQIQEVISNVNERNRLKISQGSLYGISSSPQEPLVALGGSDKVFRVLNLKSHNIMPTDEEHLELIRVVRFSSTGKLIASGSLDSSVKIWDFNGNFKHSLIHKDKVYDISLSSDDQLIAAAGKGRIISIWNANKFVPFKTFVDRSNADKEDYKIYGLDFHPRNKSILVTTGYENHDIAIWNLQKDSTQEPKKIGNTKSATTSVRFSHDGNMIVSSDNSGIINIRNTNGDLLGKIQTNDNFVFYAEFSPDSKLISSISINNKIKIWDVTEAIQLWSQKDRKALTRTFEEMGTSTSPINRVSFLNTNSDSSKKSYSLISVSEDGTLGVWEIQKTKEKNKKFNNVEELLAEACYLLSDYLRTYPDTLKNLPSCYAYIKINRSQN